MRHNNSLQALALAGRGLSSNVRTHPIRGGTLKAIFVSIPLLIALSLAGCTAEQVYGTGQAWQRNQCNRLPDKADLDRCMSREDTTYESHKRQTEPERK